MRHANSAQICVLDGGRLGRSYLLRGLAVAALALMGTMTAEAGGPRWVSGPPYFSNWRVMISWYTNQPMYFTDAGDLSASVSHAAADAMVANAAAVWNVPTASLVLAKGGSLSEHISGANVYAGANGPVFPADVQTTNYAAKQIAVIYDTDGSITDMLLGSGASDPSGCLQAGVTESVDWITPEARIQHALLILNGRCTGPEPEKQLQMQYQMVRAFGRILGLGWSQTNDNVFTGSPAPTHAQALNWPIMHPIDIICGFYTYQCLPQPFTLRADDISSLEQLYFIPQGQAAPGKLTSWSNAGGSYGRISFPNGQGMEGVNVVIRRRAPFFDTAEDFETASSVSGYAFRGQSSTSMTTQGSSAAASMGVSDGDREGYWRVQSIPIPASQDFIDLLVSTQAINPLYTGPYAIGPQAGNTVSLSGAPELQVVQYLANGRDNLADFTPAGAAPGCPTSADGTEGAPAAAAQGGWWKGTLCGYGHQAWLALPVKANRSFTMEVTALDEHGLISATKAMPILGVWNSTDAPGTLPTVASAATAFNSLSVGLTAISVQSSAASSFRIAIADQRGMGRPDFAYQARTLYADNVTPADLGPDGGVVTITGLGFRQGNTVLVNGMAATVTSWDSTAIVASVPSLHDLGLSSGTVASVTVMDLSTGGSSVMTDVLRYAAPVEALRLIGAPTGTIASGAVAAAMFMVKAIAPDGYTPVVGEVVSFAATGAGATLSPCNRSICTVLTDAAGIASAAVTPTAPGTVTLTATGRSGTAAATFTATSDVNVLHLLSAPTGIATTGALAPMPLRVQLVSPDGTTPRAGAPVTLTLVVGTVRFGACSTDPCTLVTDSSGAISTTVTPTSIGSIAIKVSSVSSSVTTTFAAAVETMQLTGAPGGRQIVGVPAAGLFSVKLLAGDGTTPVAGESIVFTALGAAVRFGACGGSVCTLTTDAQGVAQTVVTATAAGSITLSAIGSAGVVTAAFTAALPDVLHAVNAPAGTIYVGDSLPVAVGNGLPIAVGDSLPTPFAVRITSADGVTAAPGRLVTFSASAGSVTFGACGKPVCLVLTDATGLASTSVSAGSPGQIGLLATADAGSAAASFTAMLRVRSVTSGRPVEYIAEGATVSWTAPVTLADNSGSVADVPVSWTGSPGLVFHAPGSISGAGGVAEEDVTAGPLAAGARAQGFACGWVKTCSPIVAQGVGASEWRLIPVSGTAQSLSSGDTFRTLVLRAVNANGDPVAGVPVQIDETVSVWEAACPGSGRCPEGATLASYRMSAVSDMDGLIRIEPAQTRGASGVTRLAAIAGFQGFVTVSLEKRP